MQSTTLISIDPNTLREEIASEVIDALKPIIEQASLPRLVDRQEMATILGISESTLDRLVKDGQIPSKVAGTRRLFEPCAVVASLPND